MRIAVLGAMLAMSGVAVAQAQGPQLPEQDRVLARQLFKEFIEINSQDSNGSVTAVAEAARNELLKAGFGPGDLILAGPTPLKQNLVVRYRGEAGTKLKPILIIGHIDVVEARREDWTTDPYQFVEKDGYFYGRGTQDMKDSDAIAVESFIRMKRDGWVPKRDIVLALTADEEGGKSNGVSWLLEHRPELMKAAFVLNPDAGGVGMRNGKVTAMGVEATEKTYADFKLTATNPGGHSSLPRPDNAIYELMHALETLESHPFPIELNPVTRAQLEEDAKIAEPARAKLIHGVLEQPMDAKAVSEFVQKPTDNALLRTTCVATMLAGGDAPNALPGMASANVNCRILPGHSQEQVRQELIKLFNDPKLKVEYMADDGTLSATAPNRESLAPPPPLPEVFVPLRSVAGKMWPGMPVQPTMEVGASDSIYTMQAGLPSYGVNGVAIDEGDERMHGRDERLKVDSFYRGAEFYYLFLIELTKP